jgi:hypothetical protein
MGQGNASALIRNVAAILALMLAALFVQLIGQRPAGATDCSFGGQVFLYSQAGSVHRIATGSAAAFQRQANGFGNCAGAHWLIDSNNFLFSESASYYYEIGAVHDPNGFTPFSEVFYNGTVLEFYRFTGASAPCGTQYADYGSTSFLIQYLGSGWWGGYIDCTASGINWIQFDQQGAYAQNGTPRAEVERYIAEDTVFMYQYSLSYRSPVNSGWYAWTSMQCLPAHFVPLSGKHVTIASSNSWYLSDGTTGC